MNVSVPALSEKDIADLEFALGLTVDFVALSFVRSPADIDLVHQIMDAKGVRLPVIAKVEKPEAVENLEAIIDAFDGIMVARGDLGIELPIAKVPVIQKRLIRSAGLQSKAAITATQMLASMVSARRPTRAEVTDVANAIFDGTDAVMLSEETAIGAHPVEAVRVMDRIACETEPDLPYGDWLFTRTDQHGQDVGDSVAQGAVGAVYRLNLAALVVPTTSGRTARLVSAHRPKVPVLAMSPRIETVRRLNLLFGVTAVLSEPVDDIRDLLDHCAGLAAEHGIAKSGDLIAITAGLPEQQLGTNLFEVHRVP
jgi:pyruvate kinase